MHKGASDGPAQFPFSRKTAANTGFAGVVTGRACAAWGGTIGV
jgi:hypothetical protein